MALLKVSNVSKYIEERCRVAEIIRQAVPVQRLFCAVCCGVVSQAAVGLELWSMSNGILFDNFIVTDSKRVADQWAADSWRLKQSEESAASVSDQCICFIHIRPENCHRAFCGNL